MPYAKGEDRAHVTGIMFIAVPRYMAVVHMRAFEILDTAAAAVERELRTVHASDARTLSVLGRTYVCGGCGDDCSLDVATAAAGCGCVPCWQCARVENVLMKEVFYVIYCV